MTKNKLRQTAAVWFWQSWGWFAVFALAAVLTGTMSITGWNPFPGHRLVVSWLIAAFAWSLWWLAAGASVATIALWILVGVGILVVSLLAMPQHLVGIPSAIFFAGWAAVTLGTMWDRPRRLWQRAIAWLTWPLFVVAVPANHRERYRRYRDTTRLPPLASFGDDVARKVSELRATAARVRALEAPSEPWLEVRRIVSDGCDLWADMLEGRKPWDGNAVIEAFAPRDAAWEALFQHLSPWGWRFLMWGPARKDVAV